jgi:hypothetical protein
MPVCHSEGIKPRYKEEIDRTFISHNHTSMDPVYCPKSSSPTGMDGHATSAEVWLAGARRPSVKCGGLASPEEWLLRLVVDDFGNEIPSRRARLTTDDYGNAVFAPSPIDHTNEGVSQ